MSRSFAVLVLAALVGCDAGWTQARGEPPPRPRPEHTSDAVRAAAGMVEQACWFSVDSPTSRLAANDPRLPAGPLKEALVTWQEGFHWADDPSPLLDALAASELGDADLGVADPWRAVLHLFAQVEALQELESARDMAHLERIVDRDVDPSAPAPEVDGPPGAPTRASVRALAERLARELPGEPGEWARLFAIDHLGVGETRSDAAVQRDPLLALAESAVTPAVAAAAFESALSPTGAGSWSPAQQVRAAALAPRFPNAAASAAGMVAADPNWDHALWTAPLGACVDAACDCAPDDPTCHGRCAAAQLPLLWTGTHRAYDDPRLTEALGACVAADGGALTSGVAVRDGASWTWRERRDPNSEGDPVDCGALPAPPGVAAVTVVDGRLQTASRVDGEVASSACGDADVPAALARLSRGVRPCGVVAANRRAPVQERIELLVDIDGGRSGAPRVLSGPSAPDDVARCLTERTTDRYLRLPDGCALRATFVRKGDAP